MKNHSIQIAPRGGAESAARNARLFLLLIPIAFFWMACGSSGDTSTHNGDAAQESKTADLPGYAVETVTYAAEESECEGRDCTNIEVVIPRLKSESGDTGIADKINRQVEEQFREMVKARLPEPMNAPWEVMTEKFIEGFELFLMEFPDSEQSWFLHLNGSKSQIRSGRYIVHIDDHEYMGGAHPNAYVMLKTYDLGTGNAVDVLDELNVEKLEAVAERHFRHARGLDPDSPLDDEGFLFPEGRFVLAENIALIGDTVWMIYNPYEVAAYSEGATELRIALDEIAEEGETLP